MKDLKLIRKYSSTKMQSKNVLRKTGYLPKVNCKKSGCSIYKNPLQKPKILCVIIKKLKVASKPATA